MYGLQVMDWHPEAHDPKGAIPFPAIHRLAYYYAMRDRIDLFRLRFMYERANYNYPPIASTVDEDKGVVYLYFDHKRWGHIYGVQLIFAGIPIETLCYEATCFHNTFGLGKQVQTKISMDKDDPTQ